MQLVDSLPFCLNIFLNKPKLTIDLHLYYSLHTFEFLKDEPIKVNAAEFGEFYDASRGFLIRYPFNWHVKEGSRRPQAALEGNPTPAAATRLVVCFRLRVFRRFTSNCIINVIYFFFGTNLRTLNCLLLN
jgi:hypothetical protein